MYYNYNTELENCQWLYVFVLDNNDIVYFVLELDWKIQMDGYPRTFLFVNHCVVAYTADERNLVPVPKYSITYKVFGSVANLLKVIGLIAHINDMLHYLQSHPAFVVLRHAAFYILRCLLPLV